MTKGCLWGLNQTEGNDRNTSSREHAHPISVVGGKRRLSLVRAFSQSVNSGDLIARGDNPMNRTRELDSVYRVSE